MNSENFYGTEARFNGNQVSMDDGRSSFPSEVMSTRASTAALTFQGRSSKKRWRIVAGLLALVVVILLGTVIGVLAHLAFNNNKTTDNSPTNSGAQGQYLTSTTTSTTTTQSTPTHTPDYSADSGYPKTCKELRKRGQTVSGTYMLKPEKHYSAIEAFCDMETDGGGWTLVAGIHESDIRRKCFSDDLWSGYVPKSQILYTGQTNWDSEFIFGNVHTCTENDYKNAVYYTANASDVMIWHVQTGMPSMIMRDRAILRYRTTNQFLQKYGGNLKELFKSYYPLTVNIERENRTTKVLDALVAKSSKIRAQVPDWYDYTFRSGRTNSINSGSLLSYGPYLTIGSGRQSIGYMYYEQEYELPASKTRINSRKNLPFMALNVIHNEEKLAEYFRIHSYMYRSVYEQNVFYYANETTVGNFKIQYQVSHYYYKTRATPIQFFFVVSNTEDWNSREPETFRRSYSYTGYRYRYLETQIDGNPSHVVFGYMMLARQPNINLTSSETMEQAHKVAKVVLEAMSTLTDLFSEEIAETIKVPVTFDQGSKKDIENMIPPVYGDYVDSGYIQFKANNLAGYPNALCPGISVKTVSPEYLCIGGISDDVSDYGTCGDFAGWGGRHDDSIHTNQPSGSAHSHRDLFSTLLIFYR